MEFLNVLDKFPDMGRKEAVDEMHLVRTGINCEVKGKSCDALAQCPGPWDSYRAG